MRGGLKVLSGREVARIFETFGFQVIGGTKHVKMRRLGPGGAETLIVANCAAPNPGHPTAPVSLTLLVGKTQAFQTMTTFPLSFDTPIRQLQSE